MSSVLIHSFLKLFFPSWFFLCFLRYQVFFGLFLFIFYFFKFSVSCIFAAAALYRCAWDGRECAGIAQSVVIAVPLQLVLLPVQQPGVHGSFTRFCSGHRSKSDWWFLPGAPHCSKAQKKNLHVLGLVKLLCVLRRGLSKISPSLHSYKVVCMWPVVRVQCSILWFLLL